MRGVLTLIVLMAICAGVFALGQFKQTENGESILKVAKEVPITVRIAQPVQGRIIRLVQAPGDVEAVLEVEISSEIVSKIVRMPVEEGDTVKQGDLLCRLDDANILADIDSAKARIAQLEAAVLQAEADVEKADRDLSRQSRLSEKHANSDLELREYLTVQKKARATHEMRKQELAQAKAYLKRLEEDLRKTVITAPISGVISKLNAKQGEVVVTGTMNNPGTVIMSISDLSKMQVRARVDEVDIPLIDAEQRGRVYLQSDPDLPVPARVFRVASKGTKQLGRDIVTFEVLLEVLSDEDRVMPGMTANVEIEVAENDDALTVPVEAVVHRMRKDLPEDVVEQFDRIQETLDLSDRVKQGQYIKVLFVKDGEKAEVRLINAGIADHERVEILDGVAMEDTIITGPYRSLDQLKDGCSVALAEDQKKKEDEKSGEAKEDKLAGKADNGAPEDKDDESVDEDKSVEDAPVQKTAKAGTP